MKFVFLHVGSKNPTWVNEVLSDYDKRLSRYVKIERRLIKTPALERDNLEKKRQKEAADILKECSELNTLVLLDEKGKGFKGSRDFSENLNKILESGVGSVGFLIGGAYGVSDDVKAKAKHIWRLSELTFNHHLAQVVLTEQVYRGISILKGLPYHND